MSLNYQHLSQKAYNERKGIQQSPPMPIQPHHASLTSERVQPPIFDKGQDKTQQQMHDHQSSHYQRNDQVHRLRNCSGCYVQQLEQDIQDLLKQMKNGELAYDKLVKENQQLRTQVDSVMSEIQASKVIQAELQQLQLQLVNLKTESQNQTGLIDELRLRKIEIEKLQSEVQELLWVKKELTQQRTVNEKLLEEQEQMKHIKQLNIDRGEQIVNLKQQIQDMQSLKVEKEQLLKLVNELNKSLQEQRQDYLNLQDLTQQYKSEVKRLREMEVKIHDQTDVKSYQDALKSKDHIILELRQQLAKAEQGKVVSHEKELHYLNSENLRLMERIRQLEARGGTVVGTHYMESPNNSIKGSDYDHQRTAMRKQK